MKKDYDVSGWWVWKNVELDVILLMFSSLKMGAILLTQIAILYLFIFNLNNHLSDHSWKVFEPFRDLNFVPLEPSCKRTFYEYVIKMVMRTDVI